MREKLAGYGEWTYRGAWALEIAAASLGLATGLALGYQAFSSAESGAFTSTDLVLASAPFFMVAIAELTKIPIATLLFSVSWLWKPVVFVGLIALAGITFETVFMGLERAVTLRQYHYEEIVRNIDALRAEQALIAERTADSTLSDMLNKAQNNLSNIAAQADNEHKAILGQIAEAEKDIEGQRVLSPEAARIRDAIALKTTERDRLVSERDSTLKDSVSEFERQRDSFVDRIDKARKAGDADSVRHNQEFLDKLANPRPRIMSQFATKIDPIEAEIASLKTDFERKKAEAIPMTDAERTKLESKREVLKQRLQQVDTDWQDRLDAGRKQVADMQSLQGGETVAALDQQQKRKDEIADALKVKFAEKIENARTDQVRRIASRVYGSNPEDVTNEQAGFISVVWFGSLGMLAALAGPLTAIVALALQKIASTEERRSASGKLTRLVRRLLLQWRWKRVRRVNVPVEVPVDREVEKRVEVPVERIIKEILYVPILTDDPDAVRRAMYVTLPKDMADLVSISMGGVNRTSAA